MIRGKEDNKHLCSTHANPCSTLIELILPLCHKFQKGRRARLTTLGASLPILALVGGRGRNIGVAPITMSSLPFVLWRDNLFGPLGRHWETHLSHHSFIAASGVLLKLVGLMRTVLVETKGLLCLFLEELEPRRLRTK